MHIDFFIDVCIDLQMHMGRFIVAAICVRRSEGVPERRIFSLGALPGPIRLLGRPQHALRHKASADSGFRG